MTNTSNTSHTSVLRNGRKCRNGSIPIFIRNAAIAVAGRMARTEYQSHCTIPICNKCHFSIHRQRSNFKRFAMDKENKDENDDKTEKNVVKHKKISKKD